MFEIKYLKTGKTIRLSNKTLWLHMACGWLDELDWKSKDLFEEETNE